jgi:transposase InsO family protein
VSCRALGVSRSWFYKWARGDRSPARARRNALAAGVARLFRACGGKCGSPRITADLRDLGWVVSVNTVAKVMAELGLAARRRRKRRSLTRAGKGRWHAPDLVGRDFTAGKAEQKWFGDGTEIITDEGKLYLASVLNLRSRRILGFALSGHRDAGLAHGALAMAAAVRGGNTAGVIFHTDRGSEGEHRCGEWPARRSAGLAWPAARPPGGSPAPRTRSPWTASIPSRRSARRTRQCRRRCSRSRRRPSLRFNLGCLLFSGLPVLSGVSS